MSAEKTRSPARGPEGTGEDHNYPKIVPENAVLGARTKAGAHAGIARGLRAQVLGTGPRRQPPGGRAAPAAWNLTHGGPR